MPSFTIPSRLIRWSIIILLAPQLLCGCPRPDTGPHALALGLDMSCSGDQASGACAGDGLELRQRRCAEAVHMAQKTYNEHPGQPLDIMLIQTGTVQTKGNPITLLTWHDVGGEPPDHEMEAQESARMAAAFAQLSTQCVAQSRVSDTSPVWNVYAALVNSLQAKCVSPDGAVQCKTRGIFLASDLLETFDPGIKQHLFGRSHGEAELALPAAIVPSAGTAVQFCGVTETTDAPRAKVEAAAKPTRKGKAPQPKQAETISAPAVWRPLVAPNAVFDPVCNRAAPASSTKMAQVGSPE